MTKRSLLLFTVLAFVLCVSTLNAQKVALHSSTGISHFIGENAFIDAYNNANSGDTIYLPGGTFKFSQDFKKQLTIYGAGFHQDTSQVTGVTYVNSNINFYPEANNSYIVRYKFYII